MTPYHNQNESQYQNQYQNQYEDINDNSNYYNICYPKYANQHHSLQQTSAYAYQDSNHAKYDYSHDLIQYDYSHDLNQNQQQNYSTKDNIHQNVYENETNSQSYSTSCPYPSYPYQGKHSINGQIGVYDDMQNYDENMDFYEGFKRKSN